MSTDPPLLAGWINPSVTARLPAVMVSSWGAPGAVIAVAAMAGDSVPAHRSKRHGATASRVMSDAFGRDMVRSLWAVDSIVQAGRK